MDEHHHYYGEFVGFLWVGLWIAFGLVFTLIRMRERARIYDLIEKASAEGRTLPPELLEQLRWRGWRWGGRPNCVRDLRIGLILLAVSAGMALTGVINYFQYAGPNPQLFYGPAKAFPIPGLIGLAFLAMAWFGRNQGQGKDDDRGRGL